jgi:hypothetical protein
MTSLEFVFPSLRLQRFRWLGPRISLYDEQIQAILNSGKSDTRAPYVVWVGIPGFRRESHIKLTDSHDLSKFVHSRLVVMRDPVTKSLSGRHILVRCIDSFKEFPVGTHPLNTLLGLKQNLRVKFGQQIPEHFRFHFHGNYLNDRLPVWVAGVAEGEALVIVPTVKCRVRFLGAVPVEITNFELPIGIGSFSELIDFFRTESYRFAPAVVGIEGIARPRVEDVYRGGVIEVGTEQPGQGKTKITQLDAAASDFSEVLWKLESGDPPAHAEDQQQGEEEGVGRSSFGGTPRRTQSHH